MTLKTVYSHCLVCIASAIQFLKCPVSLALKFRMKGSSTTAPLTTYVQYGKHYIIHRTKKIKKITERTERT